MNIYNIHKKIDQPEISNSSGCKTNWMSWFINRKISHIMLDTDSNPQ
jgi:hypothetical protein